MRDEQDGGGRECFKQSGEQFLLRRFVERTTDFVKQENAATVDQSTGDGNTLGLSLAESAASLTKFDVEIIMQVKDKISTGNMQNLSQFVSCGIGRGLLQVIADGAAHQCIAL